MKSNDEYQLIFKIILIGDTGVGKTNILSQYINQTFISDSKATVGVEFGSKILTIDNVKIKAQIWDTAGQEKYRAITKNYYIGTKGAFIVYDITRPETFEAVDKWLNDLKSITDKEVAIIMVGNKIDLKEKREVSTRDGENKAKKFELGFIETSATSFETVDQAFNILVGKLYKDYQMRKEKGINEENKLSFDKGDDINKVLTNEVDEEKKRCFC